MSNAKHLTIFWVFVTALLLLSAGWVGSPADPFIEKGVAYAEAGDLEAALTQFSLGVDADPASPIAYYNRGLAYRALGEPDLALADLDRAAALPPYNGDVLIIRGNTRMGLGDLAGAVDDYTQVLENTPDPASSDLTPAGLVHIYNQRAQAYQGLGDVPAMVADLEALLAVDPWDTLVYDMVRDWRPLVDGYEEALSEHEWLVAAMGKSEAATRYDEGMRHLLQTLYLEVPGANSPERLALAEDAFSAAIAADPKMAIAYHKRGLTRAIAALNLATPYEVTAINFVEGETVMTLRDVATGEKQTMDGDLYSQMLSDVYDRQVDQAAVAQADLEKALALNPAMAEALYDQGILQYFLWDLKPFDPENVFGEGLQQTVDLLGQVVDRMPEWDKARFGRGLVLLFHAEDSYPPVDIESLELVRADGEHLVAADPTQPYGHFLVVASAMSLANAGVPESGADEHARVQDAYVQAILLTGRPFFEALAEDMLNQLRFSDMPNWPQRLRAGRLAMEDDELRYVNDEAGFRVTFPEMDMGLAIGAYQLQDGPLDVSFCDGARRFDLVAASWPSGKESFEQWLETRVLPVFAEMQVDRLEPIETPYGEAVVLRLNNSRTLALLPMGDKVYGFVYGFAGPNGSGPASSRAVLSEFVDTFVPTTEVTE